MNQRFRHLKLSAVAHEDDELITAIEHDHDDEVWTLEKTPDVARLDEFWTGVEEDLKKDPEWFSFEDSQQQ
jgi:hypothetical protein